METNFQIWCRVSAKHLADCMAAHPDEYMPGMDPIMVADKMNAAFWRGSASKDSRACKATCKTLGIKHTYAATRNFLHKDEA